MKCPVCGDDSYDPASGECDCGLALPPDSGPTSPTFVAAVKLFDELRQSPTPIINFLTADEQAARGLIDAARAAGHQGEARIDPWYDGRSMLTMGVRYPEERETLAVLWLSKVGPHHNETCPMCGGSNYGGSCGSCRECKIELPLESHEGTESYRRAQAVRERLDALPYAGFFLMNEQYVSPFLAEALTVGATIESDVLDWYGNVKAVLLAYKSEEELVRVGRIFGRLKNEPEKARSASVVN